jgi:hypothetical protein
MAVTVLVHIVNEDPIVLDVDDLPDPTDQYLIGMNPRYRDGKDVSYVMEDVTTILFPWHRITFVEILPSEEDERIEGIVRD